MNSMEKIVQNFDRKHTSVLTTAVLTVAALWFVKRAIRKSKEFKSSGAREIPTPDGQYFYLGHLPLLGDYPGFKVTEWHRQLGPIFRIKAGVQNWVFIGEPEAAHEIFVTKGALSSGRPFLTYGNGIHGEGNRGVAFIDNNKNWKGARTASLNILSPKSIDSLHAVIEKQTRIGTELLIHDYLKNPEEGINPMNYTRISAINFILSTVFGLPGVGSIEEDLYKDITRTMEQHIKLISVVGDLSAYYPIMSFFDVIFRKESSMRNFAENEQRPVYRELVRRSRESGQPCMIKQLDGMKESLGIDEENIVILAIEMMIGGVDTVSHSLSFSLAVLCHHPDWQQKMIVEIDSFIKENKRMPIFMDRAKLPNVLAVLKESLRYRPSAYLGIAHRATEDIAYKDYVIPKGTVLISNNHSTNNDSNTYSEPEKFKPERYLGDSRSIYASSNTNVANREMFTFGWGRRMCPGIYLAETEMFNWLCQLLSRCTIEPIISPTGEKIYPDINDCCDLGAVVTPVPYKIRLLERL